jgi:hypothetical protein
MFVLAGGSKVQIPRYGVVCCPGNPTFPDPFNGLVLADRFHQIGGVVIAAGSQKEYRRALGDPVIAWVNDRDEGAAVYASEDVRHMLPHPFR